VIGAVHQFHNRHGVTNTPYWASGHGLFTGSWDNYVANQFPYAGPTH
jgi:hypothetical protein